MLDRLCAWQCDQHIGEVAVAVDPVGDARLQQRVQVRAGVGAGHRVAEQPVLSADAERTDRVFAGVVIDRVVAVFHEARELGPLRGRVVQRLAEQAAGQHAVQVPQQQGLDLGEHLSAAVLTQLLQRVGIELIPARIGLEVVQLADEIDEASRQLVRAALVLRQRLQRLVEAPAAMGPTPEVHELVRLGDGVVRLIAVRHQHAAFAHALVQEPGGGQAAAGRVGEQSDRRPGPRGAGGLGYLHPHVALGLCAAAGFLEHLHFSLVAVDQRRFEQAVAQQVHHRLHRFTDAHDAGGQRVARRVGAAEAAQQRGLAV